MKINFKKRPIINAPTEVLNALYYYTVQYGLSVKQFTGKHWKEWDKLPFDLEKSIEDHDRLKLIINDLKENASKSKYREERRRQQRQQWDKKEVVINAQLLSLLAAFPGEILSKAMSNLYSWRYMPQSLEVVNVEIEGFSFVEPDLLLMGDDCLIMVELKTRGSSKSTRSYPMTQLTNYLKLAKECITSKDKKIPSHFSHIILMPTNDIKWLIKGEEWVEELNNEAGQMVVNKDRLLEVARDKHKKDYKEIVDAIKEVPIYFRSWENFADSFDKTIKENKDNIYYNHWFDMLEELKVLSKRSAKHV